MKAHWCMACISSLIGFYFYLYIDGVLLLVLSSQCILLYYIACRNTAQRACFQKIVVLRMSLTMATAGSLIGYISGFRYHMMQLTGYEYGSIISMLGALSGHIIRTFVSFHAFLSRMRVEEVAHTMYDALIVYTQPATASLVLALTTGIRSYLHLAFSDLVRRSGISHLLALSGFHLSILLVMVDYFWKSFPVVRKIPLGTYIVTTSNNVIIWVYGVWIGFNPSLYRAMTMYSLASICKVIFGKSTFLHVWVMSGLLLQAIYPPIMYSHGFALSMLALLGVKLGIYFHSTLSGIIPPVLSLPFMIGVGAILCTAWYSYIFFGVVYPIGLFVSILLTPLIALCMICGIVLFLLLALPMHGITQGMAIVVGKGLDICVEVVRLVLSYSARSIAVNSPRALVLCYSVIVGVMLLYKYITLLLQHYDVFTLLWNRFHKTRIICT